MPDQAERSAACNYRDNADLVELHKTKRGKGKDRGKPGKAVELKEDMGSEPNSEIKHYPDYGRSYGGQSCRHFGIADQTFYIRSTDENEHEARQKSEIGGDKRTGNRCEDLSKRGGMVPAGQEADKLHYHDQRPGGRLGKAKSIHHLQAGQPAVLFDSGLGDLTEQ